MGTYNSKHPPRKHLVLDLIGSGEEAEATAHIVYDKHEHFQWVGQYETPVRPFHDGLEGMIEFIQRMKRVATALRIKLQFTKEFRQEMRELRKDERPIKSLPDRLAAIAKVITRDEAGQIVSELPLPTYKELMGELK